MSPPFVHSIIETFAINLI